jgi:hypothetical protein
MVGGARSRRRSLGTMMSRRIRTMNNIGAEGTVVY